MAGPGPAPTQTRKGIHSVAWDLHRGTVHAQLDRVERSGALLGASVGPTGANLGQLVPTWGHHGANQGQLGANLCQTWADLEPAWANLGPTWGQPGPIRGQPGPTWGQRGANLGPPWGQLGPTWGRLGANLGQPDANLGAAGANLGQMLRDPRGRQTLWNPWGRQTLQVGPGVVPACVRYTSAKLVSPCMRDERHMSARELRFSCAHVCFVTHAQRTQLGRIVAHVRRNHVGANLGQPGANLGQLGANLSTLGQGAGRDSAGRRVPRCATLRVRPGAADPSNTGGLGTP